MPLSLRRAGATAAFAIVALAATAAATASTATEARVSDDSLSVAVSFAFTNYVAIYTAQAAGLFQKHGVDVKLIENTGPNTLNLLASGQADVAMIATPQGLTLAKQGLPITFFSNWSRDPGSWLVGGKGVKTLADLKALGSNCHVGALPVGQQSYGYAQVYTHNPTLGLGQCTVDPIPTSDQILARFGAGQISAISSPYSIALPAIKNLGGTVLINPELPGYRKKYGLPEFSSASFFGITGTLESKRAAVVKFLAALNDANKITVPKNLTLLTNYLRQSDTFKPTEFATLRTALQHTIRFNGQGANLASATDVKARPNALVTNPQYISAEEWNIALRQFQGYGLANFDANDPVFAYKDRVDMSYLAQALGKKL
jgi:ABC-type nitrate/sulfonate/bicarbonate transport system substrate-binding protein